MEKIYKNRILKLIDQGESQHLDFKFAVNNSVKIARSLVAFANTQGGTLLIGVKDNGVIAGVRTVEEFYMIEAAAQMYSQPAVAITSKEWNIGGRKVLEISVMRSNEIPHCVLEADGSRQVYLRIGDSNVLANRLIRSYLKLKQKHRGGFLSFGDHERVVLNYLSDHEFITFDQMKTMAGISKLATEKILLNLLLMNVVAFSWDGHQFLFLINSQNP